MTAIIFLRYVLHLFLHLFCNYKLDKKSEGQGQVSIICAVLVKRRANETISHELKKNQNLVYVNKKIRTKVRPHSEALPTAVTESITVCVVTSIDINFDAL